MVMDVIAKMGFKNLTRRPAPERCDAPPVEHFARAWSPRSTPRPARSTGGRSSRGLLAEPGQIDSTADVCIWTERRTEYRRGFLASRL
ncbi:hypothetical protein ACNKHP_20820 [Shigella boydii]